MLLPIAESVDHTKQQLNKAWHRAAEKAVLTKGTRPGKKAPWSAEIDSAMVNSPGKSDEKWNYKTYLALLLKLV